MHSMSGGVFSVALCFFRGGEVFCFLLFEERKNSVDLALFFTVIELPEVKLGKTEVKI